MKRNLTLVTMLLALVALVTTGCKKDGEEAGGAEGVPAEGAGGVEGVPAEGAAKEVESAAKGGPSAGDLPEGVEGALAVYEKIRADLAADDIARALASAGSLEQAARGAIEDAPEALHGHLESLAGAAARLKAMESGDAEAVREAFGEVSRPVVAMLSAEPSLAEGRRVFQCPMAQGYEKWVQVSAKIENPYMGTRMLECGAETEWER